MTQFARRVEAADLKKELFSPNSNGKGLLTEQNEMKEVIYRITIIGRFYESFKIRRLWR